MDMFEKIRGWKTLVPCWLSALYVFSKSKIVHIVLFLTVNVVIGSLGVWMPILASLARPDMFAREELIKVLLAGGPYTFAVAYLAGSSSFLVYEYLDGEATANRRWKTSLGIVAFLLIILCTLLSALQTPPDRNGPNIDTPMTTSPGMPSSTTPLASPRPAGVATRRDGGSDLSISEQVQLKITLLAIFVGLGLFVVSRLSDEDLKEQFDKIYQMDAEASVSLAQRAANANDDQLKL